MTTMTPNAFPLKLRTLGADPAFQASKWLEVRFLIDDDEMEQLLQALQPFSIYLANSVSLQGEGIIPFDTFLSCYRNYIETLKRGVIPDPKDYRALFSSSWSRAADHLYAIPMNDGKQLIRIERPVLQFQSHCMDYSSVDHTFRSMVYGRDSILWGLQCSYPQIFQNPTTHQIDKVVNSPEFPNTQLFRQLQEWLRLSTIPTPFIVNIDGTERQINSPMRLGKRCLTWINQHPQLAAKQIRISRL